MSRNKLVIVSDACVHGWLDYLLKLLTVRLLLQVVLPEGSKNPSSAVPFPVNQQLEVIAYSSISKLIAELRCLYHMFDNDYELEIERITHNFAMKKFMMLMLDFWGYHASRGSWLKMTSLIDKEKYSYWFIFYFVSIFPFYK